MPPKRPLMDPMRLPMHRTHAFMQPTRTLIHPMAIPTQKNCAPTIDMPSLV